MKRTFTANIDGQIFHIDEDAYNLLQNYLEQLRQAFSSPDSNEIVTDIESRIREHFDERISAGASVIVLADVSNVITTMGRPEDISGEQTEDGAEAAGSRPIQNYAKPARKRIYRNMQNKVFGGIVGGLATYLGWNANIMRILLVVAAVATEFWPLFILYMLAWMIIPAAVTPEQILRMNGEPVNVETMGQAVIADSQPDGDNFWGTLFGIIGKAIMGIVGTLMGIAAIASLLFFLVLLAGTIAYIAFDNASVLIGLDFFDGQLTLMWAVSALVWSLLCLIVCGSLTWLAACVVFRAPGASRLTIVTLIIMSIILFVTGVVLTATCTTAI